MNEAKRLRQLLANPGPIVVPGIYDCVTARIVERAGFSAGFISGSALTASILGYPDVGLQTMPEFLNAARNMARCVEIPLIADVDTGFGNAFNVMRTVREFEAAGVAGLFFEDQTFPKRCGHYEGKNVISIEEMVVRVRGACEARGSDDFVVIARTDARTVLGLDAAIERGQAYAAAGADLVFAEALLDQSEMDRAAREIPVPLFTNMNEGGKTPYLPVDRLHELGFKIISYSGLLQGSAISAMTRALDVLKQDGTAASLVPDHLCGLAERSDLLGLQDFYDLEERLYGDVKADTLGE
jgi:2,3-dimethylmalate lyase